MIAPVHGSRDEDGARPDAERLYVLVSPSVGETALTQVRATFKTRAENAAGTSRTYYDTFDRRMAASGSVLCLADGADGRALRWEGLGGDLVRRLVTRDEPAFATDLPVGPFRSALEPLTDVRKLLPIARASGHAQRLCILGKGGKTTARVVAEAWSIQGDGRRGSEAPLSLLRFSPVRGYGGAARAVLDVLETDIGLAPLPGPALAELLGFAPTSGATFGVWPPPLAAGMRADDAARVIFRGLLRTMQANEEGTRARTDSEFLHEYRVALRRTRAGLARLKGTFAPLAIERFKRDFAWLGRVTGPVRDIDVQLLEIPSYEADLPEEARAHLEPLRIWLEKEGERSQAALVRALDSIRYERLMNAWSTRLDGTTPPRISPPDAERPIEDVARERIWKLHTRVVRRGLAIDAATPAIAVHDLRLDAKKLRYLMEFFRQLFPAKQIKGQIGALKRMQEVLGRFNDFEVQQYALQGAATGMAGGGNVPLESVLVMGRIVETLRRRQDAAREEITGRVRTFATPKNLARAERLFCPRRQEQDA